MTLENLQNWTLGIPYRQFQPSENIVGLIQGLQLAPERTLWGNSTDVRFARGCVLASFLFNTDIIDSQVLVFCDQDTVPTAADIENLVINCSEKYPMVGSNMVYRGHQQCNNWFLKNDPDRSKRDAILADYSQRNAFIEVMHCGFGLVALHRSLLMEMTDKYGIVNCGGMQVPNLFSERYLTKTAPWEIVGGSFKQQLKPKGVSDEDWTESWNKHFEVSIKETYEIRNKSVILPETYSFCERVQDMGKTIIVHLGVRPGHLEEIITRAQFPPLQPSIDLSPTVALEPDDNYSSDLRAHL